MNVNVLIVAGEFYEDQIYIFIDPQKAFTEYIDIAKHLGVDFPEDFDPETTPAEDYIEVTEAHLDCTGTSISWRWITIDDAADYTITKKDN